MSRDAQKAAQQEAAQQEAALGIGEIDDAGRYELDLRTGRWRWSDEMYRIHGYEPGAVEPSTEALVARKHPDDADDVDHAVRTARATGEPFSSVHRIVTPAGEVRTVAFVGSGERDADGEVVGLEGFVVDLTAPQRRRTDAAAAEAVRAAARTRGAIEQAKGIVVAVRGGSPDAAFDVLRDASNRTDRPLRDVARAVVEAASARMGGGFDDAALRTVLGC